MPDRDTRDSPLIERSNSLSVMPKRIDTPTQQYEQSHTAPRRR